MRERMAKLATTFPSLRGARGASPWDAKSLEEWACGPAPGSGALHSARFLLSLWNQAEWRCGRFDVFDAMASWDREHRAAFIAWAEKPWWP